MSTKELRIGIVEDEVIIAQNLFELLSDLGYHVREPVHSYEAACELLDSEQVDLMILDIRLGEGPNGISLGKKINEIYKIPFIYLTANADKETIQSAKSTFPAAYLIKPFTKNDLYAAIEIASLRFEQKPEQKTESGFIFLKDGNSLRKINTEEILFVESQHVYVKVYTRQRNFLHRSSLQQFHQDLGNSNFIQTHRSYLVNMNYANELANNQIKIDQHIVPVSRSYRQMVQEHFMK